MLTFKWKTSSNLIRQRVIGTFVMKESVINWILVETKGLGTKSCFEKEKPFKSILVL